MHSATPTSAPLEALRFDNVFVRSMPADPNTSNEIRQVHGACYSFVEPTPVVSPVVRMVSVPVMRRLGLDLEQATRPQFASAMAGNTQLPGSQFYAACYGGHQFGFWSGQLGDGRAISLGEAVTPAGPRLELQLKGAGTTPYSRHADGRAVLRSSLREFLASEAMAALGVPTTRALCLLTTGERVYRDQFYDGRVQPEPGAIVCRTAPSFLRFGSFEILAAQQRPDLVKQLADFVIEQFFPHLKQEPEAQEPAPLDAAAAAAAAAAPEADPQRSSPYQRLFLRVLDDTARLVAGWTAHGFTHGVMNTDNMSILGLTIDYGPFGFVERYDESFVPNLTDSGGRYAFGAQATAALWNCIKFAAALGPLVRVDGTDAVVERFQQQFQGALMRLLGRKLGFLQQQQGDGELLDDMFALLGAAKADLTNFHRALAGVAAQVDSPVPPADAGARGGRDAAAAVSLPELPELLLPLRAVLADSSFSMEQHADAWVRWVQRYQQRLRQDALPAGERVKRMHRACPKYILRNYLAHVAIEKASVGDFSEANRLQKALSRPFDEQPEFESYTRPAPKWARSVGVTCLSCSS